MWIAALLGLVGVMATVLAVPWALRRLPYDYFVRPRPPCSRLMWLGRNALGLVLVLAGIVMVVIPGPGIVTIVLGLAVADLPAKDRALGWLFGRPKIQEAVQRIRSKVGKQPLAIPHGGITP